MAGIQKNPKYPPHGGGDSERSKIIVLELLGHGVGPDTTKTLVVYPQLFRNDFLFFCFTIGFSGILRKKTLMETINDRIDGMRFRRRIHKYYHFAAMVGTESRCKKKS